MSKYKLITKVLDTPSSLVALWIEHVDNNDKLSFWKINKGN